MLRLCDGLNHQKSCDLSLLWDLLCVLGGEGRSSIPSYGSKGNHKSSGSGFLPHDIGTRSLGACKVMNSMGSLEMEQAASV